jgi:hypothetical protein
MASSALLLVGRVDRYWGIPFLTQLIFAFMAVFFIPMIRKQEAVSKENKK